MANSAIIGNAKKQIIKELIKDDLIVDVIDSPDIDRRTPEKLINTHIFNFNQNPYTINKSITYITVQVSLHYNDSYWSNKAYINPEVEIWIISHEKHMIVDNVPKVIDNRNDYLGKLIDLKFNGRSGFGLGKLELISSVEGAFQADYLYRKMIFRGTDINNSLCEEDE